MIEWFKGLSKLWKAVVLVGILIVGVLILDSFNGYLSSAKNWVFDRNIAKIEQKNKALEEENSKLRQDILIYKTKAEEADIKAKALDAQIDKVGGQILVVRENTEKALEEVKKEEEITDQTIDAYSRCVRTKEKLVALKIKSAGEIDCNEFK